MERVVVFSLNRLLRHYVPKDVFEYSRDVGELSVYDLNHQPFLGLLVLNQEVVSFLDQFVWETDEMYHVAFFLVESHLGAFSPGPKWSEKRFSKAELRSNPQAMISRDEPLNPYHFVGRECGEYVGQSEGFWVTLLDEV